MALPILISAAASALPQPLLLVANQKDHTISLIDPAAGKEVAAIPEDRITGHEITTSADGRTAFVPIYGDSGVGRPGTDGSEMLVIDLASRKVTDTVNFGKGVRPHCPVLRNGKLYVTTELNQTVTILDPHTHKILGSVPTGENESHMLAVTRDGRKGYTANVGSGTVSVLDLAGRKLVTTIPVSPHVQRISLSNDDARVFTSDTTQPRLAVISTATNKIEKWVTLPATGYGSASTTDGRFLLLAVPSAKKVVAIDLNTLEVVHSLDVPSSPQEVLVRPDGKEAYVSCNTSGKIAVIDLSNWTVKTLIDAGHGADGLAWAAGAPSVASAR